MNDLIKAALAYKADGLSVIPCGNDKRAIFQWKEYTVNIPTDEIIAKHFAHPKCSSLAVICGKVSGNLEVIDVDLKYDLSGNLYDNIVSNIPEELFKRLRVIKTKSNGYHFYYRCDKIAGSQKLAWRHADHNELKDNPNEKQKILIETKAEAGYVIAPPSKGYIVINDVAIPHITIDEREVLLEICRSFNEVTDEIKIYPKESSDRYSVKCWDDYNKKCDCIALLEKHGWIKIKVQGERTFMRRPGKTDSIISGDYHAGLNLFKAFTTSSQFEPGKGYSPFGVYCLLEHGGDPSKAAKQLIKDGFGEKAIHIDDKIKRTIRKLREAGYDNDQIAEKIIRDHNMNISSANDVIKEYDQNAGVSIATFWDVNDKGVITISRNKLERFLKFEGGFGLYFYDKSSTIFRIVQEKDGFIDEVSTERIKKFIKNYVYSLEPSEPFDHGTTVNKLLEVIYKGSDAYFSKGMFEFLDEKDFDFLKDTHDTAFFPFKNGVVCVTKTGIEIKTYGEIKKVIWKSQVIDFDVTIDNAFDPALCEFTRFVKLISKKEDEKYNYCCEIIGYMLHKYKDSSRPYSIILAEETEDESKGGGTGKGILVTGISKMINTERIDGKNFKLDKNFAFQRVGLDTRIVSIEDVRKNVDFEGFYAIITEGMTVEKKNKDELFIPFTDSPKIIFTTNYTIPSVGVHSQRRQRLFEFYGHFSLKHTPNDEFGHNLFDDWDADEWNRFYNFMFLCVQKYLEDGVRQIDNSDKLNRKHIKINFGEEFLEYFDILSNYPKTWHVFGNVYEEFLIANNLEKKDYSSKKFKKAIIETSNTLKIAYKSRRNRQAGNQTEFCLGQMDENMDVNDEKMEVRDAIF